MLPLTSAPTIGLIKAPTWESESVVDLCHSRLQYTHTYTIFMPRKFSFSSSSSPPGQYCRVRTLRLNQNLALTTRIYLLTSVGCINCGTYFTTVHVFMIPPGFFSDASQSISLHVGTPGSATPVAMHGTPPFRLLTAFTHRQNFSIPPNNDRSQQRIFCIFIAICLPTLHWIIKPPVHSETQMEFGGGGFPKNAFDFQRAEHSFSCDFVFSNSRRSAHKTRRAIMYQFQLHRD